MNSTFAMWRKSLSQLIMMQEKKEWDALDTLSKWFIATRSVVGTITLNPKPISSSLFRNLVVDKSSWIWNFG